MTTEPKLSLVLTVSQVNTILAALNEAPYRASAPIIAFILEQANASQQAHSDPTAF